jgi:hypothetical protein
VQGKGVPADFLPESSRLQHGVAFSGDRACRGVLASPEGQLPGAVPVRPIGVADRYRRSSPAAEFRIRVAKVALMSLFRRRERPDTGPSYAEEESNPELLAAEKAVNQMPSVPMVGGLTGVILGQRPQIVGLPDEAETSEDDEESEKP